MTGCTYCGCDVTAHSPVVVEEGWGDERERAGQFCNYGRLAAHVERQGLATGTTCRVNRR
ncbi:MAG: hypothetical protein ABEJ78_10010 [Haloferacaceae archaeon]